MEERTRIVYHRIMDPFLCVITPIFDEAVEALELLIDALKKQTMKDFIHIMISAGLSEKSRDLIKSLNDPRFKYEEYEKLKNNGVEGLIENIGERRTYCFKNYKAQRYVFLDADLEIKSDDYFLRLQQHHFDADILITKVWVWPPKKNGGPTVLPKYPLTQSQIDLSNFSFSKRVADHPECVYPTDMGLRQGRDVDWRFFETLIYLVSCFRRSECPSLFDYPSDENYKIIPLVSAVYNGNSTYTSVSKT